MKKLIINDNESVDLIVEKYNDLTPVSGRYGNYYILNVMHEAKPKVWFLADSKFKDMLPKIQKAKGHITVRKEIIEWKGYEKINFVVEKTVTEKGNVRRDAKDKK